MVVAKFLSWVSVCHLVFKNQHQKTKSQFEIIEIKNENKIVWLWCPDFVQKASGLALFVDHAFSFRSWLPAPPQKYDMVMVI